MKIEIEIEINTENKKGNSYLVILGSNKLVV